MMAIREIVMNLIHSGGKRLRPAYDCAMLHIGDKHDKKRVIDIACAIEYLHLATLVHDDVIDQADMRRHQPTIHTRYGNKFAIYTGDYLFSLAFTLISKHASFLTQARISTRKTRKIEKILIGELQQLHSAYSTSVSVKDYLSRISGKTAQLFAIGCYCGALAGGHRKNMPTLPGTWAIISGWLFKSWTIS